MSNIVGFGRLANGLRFDAVDDSITVAHNAVFDLNSDFTVSMLVMFNSAGGIQRLVSKQESMTAAPKTWGLITAYAASPNVLGFHLYSNTDDNDLVGILANFTPIVGRFHHLCFVKNTGTSTNWRIYADGVALATTPRNSLYTVLTANPNNTKSVSIGTCEYPEKLIQMFNGYFFNIAWFNRALTAIEVQQLFNKENFPPASAFPNQVDRWDFREKQGTVLNTKSGLNNGVLHNFANSSVGASNAWVKAYTLIPLTS